jgi:hypothetical protein
MSVAPSFLMAKMGFHQEGIGSNTHTASLHPTVFYTAVIFRMGNSM